MMGSASSKLTELTQLRGTFHVEKKEMILKNRGRGPERGRGSGLRSHFPSADDGKRFVEVNGVNAAALDVSG